MEKVTLTVPVSITKVTSDYTIAHIHLNRFPTWNIDVLFLGTNGEMVSWVVKDSARAQTLITALNKVNLTTKSLERRCMEQAIADGVFAGAVTGTPD